MDTHGGQTTDRREFLTRVPAVGALALAAAARNAGAEPAPLLVVSAAGPVPPQPVDVVERIPFAVYVIGAPILWNQELLGDGVLVGVVDSGVDDRHPALMGQVLARHDYVGDGVPVDERHWHGTFAGGLIAANAQLSFGALVSGMAPHARLADYRVIGADGTGSAADVAAAIDQAAADGCHVIYLGVASGTDHARIRNAIRRAARKHALVVCGAGDNGDASLYPGRYPNVLTCGGMNYDPFPPPGVDPITHLPTSGQHDQVDIAADGGTLIGCGIQPATATGPVFVIASGSSLSAAIIAGGAALMLQKMWARSARPVRVDQLRAAMLASTVDILALGRDTKSGAGVFSFLPELPAPDPTTSAFRLPNLDPFPENPQPL